MLTQAWSARFAGLLGLGLLNAAAQALRVDLVLLAWLLHLLLVLLLHLLLLLLLLLPLYLLPLGDVALHAFLLTLLFAA